MTRMHSVLPLAEVATFNSALCLYLRKPDVDQANPKGISDISQPVLIVNALHDHEHSIPVATKAA